MESSANQFPPQPDSPQNPNAYRPYQAGEVIAPGGPSQPPAGFQPAGMPPYPADNSSPSKWHFLNRRALLFLIPLLLIGASAAAYFGYYVPNKPENMWHKALENTGKGYDKLSEYATSHKDAKGISVKGSFKVDGPIAADGTFEGKSDGGNGEFSGSLSASGLKINLDLKTIKSNSTAPDVYFRVNGLQGLGSLLGAGDEQFATALNGLNNHWYFIDHSLFNQYAKGADTNLQFSSNDVNSVLKAVGDASKQNVFTSDPSKAAFTVKQNVGKEKQDGRNVYHYKVGVNKQNLKNYVSSLCSNLKNSSLKKLFNGNTDNLENALGCKKADKAINQIDASESSDVWVDTHTKLIHKIRFTEKNKKDNYFDIGQDYQGGDIFPFMLAFHTKDGKETSSGNLNLKLNTKTNTLSITGSAKTGGTNAVSGSLDLTISTNNSPVKVEKPSGSRTLIELLNDLGLPQIFDSTASRAQDTERKTDINALHGQIEVYYAINGYYPTLAQINDSTWRAANMKGLDTAALIDPAGSISKLSSKPAAHVYAYQATPAGCSGSAHPCTSYTLTATLDNGQRYSKQSLN